MTRLVFQCVMLIAVLAAATVARAQHFSIVPKFGGQTLTTEQLAANAEFVAAIDAQYKGDRVKAAEDLAKAGWASLTLEPMAWEHPMRRFNQAWMVNPYEPTALWGMAVATSRSGDNEKAAALMVEARYHGRYYENARFLSDFGLIVLNIAVKSRYESTWKEAVALFEKAYRADPQLTVNLFNWSLAYFAHAQYEDAAAKLELALATPGGSGIGRDYIALIEQKINRPIIKKEQ